ncbi:uncharacterized protein PAC_08044 [Phialocephala subalpina]|uniref:SET domain-containing protein n=1 Tax=Phialocephala subalpina TaxID=576137 RepID=A0A1L7WZF2_9HELO|nr:uncharacterized protein PAC_08044 [Phialocephala subalpina]
MDKVNELIQWGLWNGIQLHNRVGIYEDPAMGLSFRALGTIPPETQLAVSPPTTALSYLNAVGALDFKNYDSPQFPPEFIGGLNDKYPYIIGNFFLMQQFLMREKSHWWQYIQTLPQPDQPERLATPLWWSDEDLQFLAGTNAELYVERKHKSWTFDYNRGFTELRGRLIDADKYTFDLYKWAATIFGTRSFRPSLTVSVSARLYEHYSTVATTTRIYSLESTKAIEHVREDGFPILYPVLDIGNHNGKKQMRWSTEPGSWFKLTTTVGIAEGCQIFNHYGTKSNSELLVGYGFMLESSDADIVNLKVHQMSKDISALTLRRSQTCHQELQKNRPLEEEWIYSVSIPEDTSLSSDRPSTLKYYSEGLFDSLSCLVANVRERRFLEAHPEPTHSVNQSLALNYRIRQSQVYKKALLPLEFYLDVLYRYDSFCGHPQHSISQMADNPATTLIYASVELLSLECAYEWLSQAYPEVYSPLSTFVSQFEQEPDPPRWGAIAEDFGNIYWTVWLFIVYVLEIESESAVSRHLDLSKWLSRMHGYFLEQLDSHDSLGNAYGDTQERESIQNLIDFASSLPSLNTVCGDSMIRDSIQEFTMCIAFQETIGRAVIDKKGDLESSKTFPLLCIGKTRTKP